MDSRFRGNDMGGRGLVQTWIPAPAFARAGLSPVYTRASAGMTWAGVASINHGFPPPLSRGQAFPPFARGQARE